MSSPGAGPIRAALKSAIATAMKHRDQSAIAAYRTALAAIDNAEAVPLDETHRAGAIEATPAGVGGAEVQRRALTEREMVRIVLREATDRLLTAESLARANPDAASRLRREAEVLQALVDGS